MENCRAIAKKMRLAVVSNSYKVGACHIGSALSCVDILVDLYWRVLKKGDVFLFSKASGAAALYCVLAEKGYFPKSKVAYYLKHYPLASREVPGVIHSVGSLGHGLPVACGLALADRKRKVYCLISDAEMQEGTFWESLLFKWQHNLRNLKIIVDANGLQACGWVDDILTIPIIEDEDIKVVRTTKGKGVSFLENEVGSHYLNLNKETYAQAVLELDTRSSKTR